MKLITTITLSLLVLGFATLAQAGYVSPGLESQLSDLNGDDTIKVLVVMSEQTDIHTLDQNLHNAKTNFSTRHRTVIETLQEVADRTQFDLLASLENNKNGGGILGYTPHWLVNGVVVVGTVDAIRQLAARSDVERIEPDLVVELIEPIQSEKQVRQDKDAAGIGITPGVIAVKAQQVWNDLGIDGTGVVVGILDTGVDGNHPALAARWRGNFAPASECWLDAANLGNPDFPVDDHYHGTHVMGTVTGLAPDDTIGVAPGALWIATNIIDSSTGTAFDNGVIASLEFMADPDGNPLTTDDVPAVVQNSWGVNENFTGYFDCDSRWWSAIDACEAAGVCLTWSAGNEGPGGTSLRSPADRAESPTNCFSVGSTLTSPPYEISDFSSRGPSGCGGQYAIKPEICAPGSDIYSAQPGGGYQYLSGTSMAGPHIAGVVALMKASNPNVDVITIKEVLMATAIDLGAPGEENTYGHGFVDAYQAVLAVMGGIGSVEGYVTDNRTGNPISGVRVERVGGFNFDITDANGYYSMTMPIGDVELLASVFGYWNKTINVSILEDQTVNGDMNMITLPSSTISGTVYGPDSNVVEGARVGAIGTPTPEAVTNAAGFYSLTLPSGGGEFYDIVARASGMGSQVQNVELVSDLTLDFSLPEWIGEDFETGNFINWPWVMSGADWVIDNAEVYEGTYSARSGNIGDNQSSSMSVTIDVPAAGQIRFWYKVSSESGYDYLQFLLDGNLVAEWAGEAGWAEYVHPVPAGTHTYTFQFDKDGSLDGGSDAGWIDFIEFYQPGIPAISVDTTPISVTLAPDLTQDVPLLIENVGDADLFFALNLVEVGTVREPMVTTVPDQQFGKGEKDTRPGVSPATGFGGPDVFGYDWIDSDEAGGPVYSWVDISGDGHVVGTEDDFSYGPFNLEFPFSYYGNVFNSVRVSTNGFLSFTSTSYATSNQGIPNSSVPNNLIAPFWDDLDPSAGGSLLYRAEPGRFIVQWQNVPHYQFDDNGLPVTFQVILNSDGSIVYQYQLVQDFDECTVGIEDAAGTDGLEVCFNSNTYLHNELAIRFSTAPPLTWVTANPLVGSILEAANQEVTLTFDSTGLVTGIFEAILNVGSNDPVNEAIAIPIELNVGSTSAVGDRLPSVVQFTGAVPNPFNPATDLKFSIPRDAVVSLKLYDVSGRLVRNLVNERMSAGHHDVRWNGRDDGGRSVASGTYFVRLLVDGVSSVKSVALVR